jgi:hypothetical protein
VLLGLITPDAGTATISGHPLLPVPAVADLAVPTDPTRLLE